jgi:hydroxypyruvate isomerase
MIADYSASRAQNREINFPYVFRGIDELGYPGWIG